MNGMPEEQAQLYRALKRRVHHELPEPLKDKELTELRSYLGPFQEEATQDYTVDGLRQLAKALGKIAAFRSRVSLVLIEASTRLMTAEQLRLKASYALSTVRALAAESDAVLGISRADLRREKIFEISRPFARVSSKVKSRVLALESQMSICKLLLKELDALQRNLSRQVAAIQLDLTVTRGG